MNRAISFILVVVILAAVGCESRALVRRYDGPYIPKPYIYGDRYTTVDGVRICYTTRGKGPTVIFLRGVGGTADYWEQTMPHFADDFTVYALDLPGFGKSSKPDVNYSVDFFTRQVLGFMEKRGIDRASFVGNSLGGHIAMNIAIHHPERVDKLVVQATTGVWRYPNPLFAMTLPLIFTDTFFYRWNVRNWYGMWCELTLYKTPYAEEKLKAMIRFRHSSDFRKYCRAYSRGIKGVFYGTLRGTLHRIKAPTLILWGDDDYRHPLRDARYLHAQVPDSRLVIFRGGHHMLPWDFKDDFNREVMTFLKNPADSNFDVKMIDSSPLAGKCPVY